MELSYSDIAKELKSKYIKKYQDADDETIAVSLQEWITSRNKSKGYLPGLSPRDNITQLAEIFAECGRCTKHNGTCHISHVLKNMASVSSLLEILEDNNSTGKLEEIMEVVNEGYEPYVILNEFVCRSCKGNWWNPAQ